MKSTLEEKDAIVYVDGKKYRLLDIDETGEHPVLRVEPYFPTFENFMKVEQDIDRELGLEENEMDDDIYYGEYLSLCTAKDVRYLIWKLTGSCSGTYNADYEFAPLTFILEEVCETLMLDYEDALQTFGEDNVIHGSYKQKEYTAITDVQLVTLLIRSPLESAQKLGTFLIENSPEIKQEATAH